MTIQTATQNAPSLRPFPSIWAGLLWLIAFFAIQFLVTVLAIAIYTMQGGQMPDLAQGSDTVGFLRVLAVPIMWGIAASGAVTLFALWLYLRRNITAGESPITSAAEDIEFHSKNKSRAAMIGLGHWSKLPLANTIILAGAVLIAAYAFNFIYGTYVIPDVESQIETTELIKAFPKNPINWVVLFMAISILPGITEELVFRGLLQNSLAHLMPAGFAIALSSGIFAAVHMQLAAFPALMCLGAAYGYIYHKTGSLRINIALHALNNGAALLLSQIA
jgi:uncharacterized protein